MPVHVQLTVSKYIDVNGTKRSFQPGDWVMVGKQIAREWLEMGHAVDPFANAKKVDAPPDTVGMMLFGAGDAPDIEVPKSRDGAWELRWQKTLFLDTTAPVRVELIPAGFSLLDRWHVAVPMYDYRKLAADEGTDIERARAQAVLHDLRVPLYDTRMVFARQCEETERLLDLWGQEGGNRLGFLTALYMVKPLVRALPCTWTGQWAPTNA